MSTKQLQKVDSLDDRREIWKLLHQIDPGTRVRLLQWECRLCGGKKDEGSGLFQLRPQVLLSTMMLKIAKAYKELDANVSLTNEIYSDLMTLVNQWNHCPHAMFARIELAVRSCLKNGRTWISPTS